MVVRRTSTVAAEARAAARARRAEVMEKRREREEKVGKLAEGHAVSLALADEVQVRVSGEMVRLQARADEEIAGHRRAADTAVVELLELGERVEAVGDLLGLTAAEVRAARRRVRGGGAGAAAEATEVAEDLEGTSPGAAAAVDDVPAVGVATSSPVGAAGVTPGGDEGVSAAA